MAVINIEDAVRVFVVAITIGSMIFFIIEYSRKRVGWEVLWVAGIEALNYTLGMTLPFEYLPVYGPYDMPMTRYISWMLTCPVLIKVMLHTVSPNPNLENHNKAIVADILMNACGFFACLYTNKVVVMSIFSFGCMPAVFIVRNVFKEWSKNREKLDQPGLRKFLMGLMLISWTLFPLLFLLGPEGFGAMTQEVSIMGHGIGDLFSKNFYGYIAYKIKIRSDQLKAAAKLMAEEEAGMKLDECGMPFPLLNMGGSQSGSRDRNGSQSGSRNASPRMSPRSMGPNFSPRTTRDMLGSGNIHFKEMAQNSDNANSAQAQQLLDRMADETRKMEKLKADMARMMHLQQLEPQY